MNDKNKFSLEGKCAIVTGGSGGIGKGIVLGLAKAGANVVISGRNEAKLKALTDEIKAQTGMESAYFLGDVRDAAFREALVKSAVDRFGKIDILVNAAGNQLRIPALDYTEADWDSILDVQLKAVFFMSQEVVKQGIKQNNPVKIINIGSLNSRFGFVERTAYVAAKGGVVQLTKTLANEWAKYQVWVNAIAPGYFNTEMTKVLFEDEERNRNLMRRLAIKRGGEPEDVEGVIVFLASEASDYITGETIYIDGGFSVC